MTDQIRRSDRQRTANHDRDRYRTLYELGPLPYQSLDEHGTLIDVNPAWLRILGYERDEVVGRSFTEFLHPDWREHFARNFPEFKRRGVVHGIQFRMRCADDRDIDVSFEGCIGYHPDGRVRQTYCIFQDITERLAAQRALEETAKRTELALRGADLGTWDWWPRTGRLEVNDRWAEMLGYSIDDLSPEVGTWTSLLHPDDRDHVMAAIDDHLAGRTEIYEVEHRLRHRDGRWVWVLARGQALEREDDGSARRFCGTHLDITERKKSEESLRLERERYRSLMRHTAEGFYLFEPPAPVRVDAPVDEQIAALYDGRIVDCNDAQARMYGFASAEDVIGQTLREIHGRDDDPENIDFLRAWIEQGYRISDAVTAETDRHGERIWIANDVLGIVEGERLVRVWGSQRDVTAVKRAEAEQEKLQAQLSQSQKMEAVGRLAGGVAHDFNNMLTVMLGNVRMALDHPDDAEVVGRALREVDGAAQRSAVLTRQLLAFARKQTAAPRVLDLNQTVEDMLSMLRRLMGEDIDLSWHPASDLRAVRIDPSQIDQLLANLCVNARDAIEDVGRVTIETHNVHVDAGMARRVPDAASGDHVMLSVADDGHGMDRDTLASAFEPFFTTKEQGTGLGLSTVYGIVRQNDGFVDVDSEPGEGTVFRICLPTHAGPVAREEPTRRSSLPGGRETILVVEDERAILELSVAMLGSLGYEVLTASSPEEARAIAAREASRIRLLLTDVILPGMNGRELAAVLRAEIPGLRTIYMSGYTADVIADRGVVEDGVRFLQKPFSRGDLAHKVREVLDE